ncbi:MAG: GFA family protein [SAR324 cluster bacterium]|nr:GFA family protein [SAR324 cluster bacterium]
MEASEVSVRDSGRCLCGKVQYEVRGALRPVIACHCNTCRRFTGGIWMATAARGEHLTILGEGNLSWYQSSARGRRGFCAHCGANLFLDHAGTLNKPTGLQLAVHIFTDEAGDYYELTDDVQKIPDGRRGLGSPESWV